MNEIHKLTIQIRAPKGSFPGEVVIGWYCVVDNAVVITDADGKPVDNVKHHLDPGQDARGLACRLVRDRSRRGVGVRGFNDKLIYPKVRF